MEISLILLSAAAAFYALAFCLHLVSFWEIRPQGHQNAALWLRLGFAVQTLYLIAEGVQQGSIMPVSGLSQSLAFFSWAVAFVYLVLLAEVQSDSFGLVLNPILFFLAAVAALAFEHPPFKIPEPAAVNLFFSFHILTAFFAYASFSLSFAAGFLYLIQHRELKSKHTGKFYHKLPSLEHLDRLIYQPLYWGVPLLFIALGIGFLWAKAAFGKYWLSDPKTLLTALVAFLYFFLLALRRRSVLRGKRVAVWSMVAFSLVLFGFAGMHFFHGSQHYWK